MIPKNPKKKTGRLFDFWGDDTPDYDSGSIANDEYGDYREEARIERLEGYGEDLNILAAHLAREFPKEFGFGAGKSVDIAIKLLEKYKKLITGSGINRAIETIKQGKE